jgi:hypothetical protein
MSDKLSLGWAVRDITPRTPVAIRGQFNLRIATKIHDPLTLTALAIEAGGEQLVLVSMDCCTVDQEVLERVRELVPQRAPGLDPRKIITGATHTHTAPFAGSKIGLQKDTEYMDELKAKYPDYMSAAEYAEFLSEALVSAVCEAWEKRAAGAVAWGYSYAVVGENRRVRYFDDHAVMYGAVNTPDFSHIEGHVDHGVQLLYTYDAAGKLTGVVVNLACPSQATEGSQDTVTADYWHDTREALWARFGRDLHVLAQCSAAGDQSPHRLVNARAEERMLRLKYGEGHSRAANYGLRKDIARRITDAVADAEPAARKELHDSVVLKHEYGTLALAHWNVTDKEYTTLQAEMKDLRARLEQLGEGDRLSSAYTAAASRLAWCKRAADRYENPPASVPAEVNVARLGDIAFVSAPFEYYLDFGDRIRGRSDALQTFVVQLTGGGGGYLATSRAAAGLSYGAVPASCKVSPEGGHMLVEHAVATIHGMFTEE